MKKIFLILVAGLTIVSCTSNKDFEELQSTVADLQTELNLAKALSASEIADLSGRIQSNVSAINNAISNGESTEALLAELNVDLVTAKAVIESNSEGITGVAEEIANLTAIISAETLADVILKITAIKSLIVTDKANLAVLGAVVDTASSTLELATVTLADATVKQADHDSAVVSATLLLAENIDDALNLDLAADLNHKETIADSYRLNELKTAYDAHVVAVDELAAAKVPYYALHDIITVNEATLVEYEAQLRLLLG